jgi:hypothetical protein
MMTRPAAAILMTAGALVTIVGSFAPWASSLGVSANSWDLRDLVLGLGFSSNDAFDVAVTLWAVVPVTVAAAWWEQPLTSAVNWRDDDPRMRRPEPASTSTPWSVAHLKRWCRSLARAPIAPVKEWNRSSLRCTGPTRNRHIGERPPARERAPGSSGPQAMPGTDRVCRIERALRRRCDRRSRSGCWVESTDVFAVVVSSSVVHEARQLR